MNNDTVICALVATHKRTCELIEKLPFFCWSSRKALIEELRGITGAIDEFGSDDDPTTITSTPPV